ncbi:hypothetical protein ABPG74_004829 [Tetrahymena malaccensis]
MISEEIIQLQEYSRNCYFLAPHFRSPFYQSSPTILVLKQGSTQPNNLGSFYFANTESFFYFPSFLSLSLLLSLRKVNNRPVFSVKACIMISNLFQIRQSQGQARDPQGYDASDCRQVRRSESVSLKVTYDVQEEIVFKEAHGSICNLQMQTFNTLYNTLEEFRNDVIKMLSITNFDNFQQFLYQDSFFGQIIQQIINSYSRELTVLFLLTIIQ